MSEELAFHEQIRRYHKELLTDVERDVGNIVESTFASRYTVSEVPKDRIPLTGMPSRVAYQLIHDIRQLDANPRLNLASFVTTVWKHLTCMKSNMQEMELATLHSTVDGARGQ